MYIGESAQAEPFATGGVKGPEIPIYRDTARGGGDFESLADLKIK